MKKLITRKKHMPAKRLEGSFKPSTLNLEARTVEVVFTTGEAGKRYDWYNGVEFIEELDVTAESVRAERLDKGLSVIDNHNTYNGIDGVFGITESYRFENGELIGTVRFATDELSDTRFKKVADGVLRHVSLGYKVHKYFKSRGENDKLDTYRAIDWEPTELSFTPVSFEKNNGIRAEHRNTYEVEITEEKTMKRFDENGNEVDENGKIIKTRADIETERSALAPAPVVAPVVAAVVDEGTVRTEVESATRAMLNPMLDAASKAGLTPEFATRAFNDGKSIDQFRAMVIDEMGAESSEFVLNPVLKSDERSDATEQTREAAEIYLMQRTGRELDSKVDAKQFNGLTLLDMGRSFLESAGVSTIGMSRQKVAERSFHSTSDFPLILQNVMNKNLQAGYVETPRTFLGLGRRTTVNDFREKHVFSVGDAPSLLPLGENGEYKSGTFSENGEKYAINTFARKLGFSRKMLINDDLSVLDRVPQMMGQAGSRLESDLVWGLILNYDFAKGAADSIVMSDGKPLFDATHKNLMTTGSAFSKISLADLRKQGRKAKTLDGNFMNLTYSALVLPEDLEQTADDLLFAPYQAGTANDTRITSKFDVRIEPRLSVISTAAWYAFSQMVDTFEYAYLAGEEEMYTEVNTSTDVDGLEIKVRKDFGAGLVDYRGFSKATGAA